MYFSVIKSKSSINDTYPIKSHPRNEIQCRIKCFCLSSQFIQNIHSVVWIWTVVNSLDWCFIHSIDCHALQLVQIGIYLYSKYTWLFFSLVYCKSIVIIRTVKVASFTRWASYAFPWPLMQFTTSSCWSCVIPGRLKKHAWYMLPVHSIRPCWHTKFHPGCPLESFGVDYWFLRKKQWNDTH